MIHNVYYRLFVTLLIGTFSYLLLPDTATAQIQPPNPNNLSAGWDWNCESCNDHNPCTVDLCFFGYCFNIPLRNCGNDSDCEVKIAQVTVGDCYVDPADNKSKAKLKVCVWWRDAPTNKDLKVWIEGEQKIIDITQSRSGDCIEFIIPADGRTNHKVWAQVLGAGDCKDEKTYKAPPACTAPCDLKITDVNVGDCYIDTDGKSKSKLEVCLDWKNRPAGEKIIVSIDGQTKSFQPGQPRGNQCVEFTVLANGTSNNGVWAKFENATACRDDAKYNAPRPCEPECELKIKSVSVGDCYFDHSDYKSKAKLTVCVEWKNRPGNENIVVSIDGQSKVVSTGTTSGSKCVEFIILANGSTYNGVWAKFQNSTDCRDDSKYHAPQPCQPIPEECNVKIKSVSVGDCWFDHNDYKSKAKLTVCVEWKNRPGNEGIVVSIDGQSQTINTTSANGSKCVDFTILANGSTNNGIWAKFQYATNCRDDAKYNAPQPCQPLPECDLNIKSVYVGDCYFDHNDYKSKAKLTVCVEWKNRPGNENIVVSISGQTQSFTPGSSSGSKCVEFIILANGTTNNGIWAKFQYTDACRDDAKYNAPQPCQPLPECELNIKSVYVGDCYFDHNDYKSKAKLTVCVEWKNRPGNENILVSIDGQSQTINTSSANGSKCVEFIILANGTTNNGIWAKFQYTSSCRDDAKYNAPQPCQPLPECDLNITSVSVGNCYFDQSDNKSKAKLSLCVTWKNRPGNENIIVSINGQSQTVYTNTANGTKCIDFVIPADGTTNNGIWAKFQYTSSCRDDDYYNAPQPCQPLPECDLNIKSVYVGDCYFDHNDYKSKAKLTVCVEWKNRPGNENILVSIDGQSQTINTSSANGSKCVEFIILANGTTNNGIWAKFQYTSSCRDDAKYNAPQPCQPLPECELDIKSVSVGDCYYDQSDNKSKAKLTVCVQWKNRPGTENIVVSINGQSQTINTNATDGTKCIDFIVPADGSTNNSIWAKFQYTTTCGDDAKYNTPQPCRPACNVDITSVEVGTCYFDENSDKSKAKIKVCVKWQNRPDNENIIVSTGNQTKTIYPSSSNGSECVEFVVAADGSTNNGIWAKFQYTTTCNDDAKYNAPQPCQPLPECDLQIVHVEVGDCYYDNCENKSKAELTVCVQWNARPDNENIIVSTGGQTQTIVPAASSGTQCIQFVVPADGTVNNSIWAKFKTTTSCGDDDKYNAPQPCHQLPECDLDIMMVEVSDCYFDHSDYKSKAKLTACIKWHNRPDSEKIIVSIDGQSQTITPNAENGMQCVEFIIPADGTTNRGIWAKFQNTAACSDEDKYNVPQPCQPLPECNLDITSVSVSDCYFDQSDSKSKAKLEVCVNWQNRPANQKIVVSINGQTQSFLPGTDSGSKCLTFIVLANGSTNNGVWAKFEDADCQDDAKYNAPQPCQPLPECDLNIKSISVGDCYFDHGDYKSKAKLTVCVEWKNRPGNENILVTAGNQTQTITPGAANGSKCIDFIIIADGSSNNGVWAKFQYTTTCNDDAKYNAPQPCQPQPCNIDITSTEISDCWYDNSDHKSKATLKICFNWQNRPANENIIVVISGQSKTFYPNASSGSGCVDFTIPADGSYNNGAWVKFQYTTTCADDVSYNAPQPCYETPACKLDITSVQVGNCYFDHNDYKSKANLKVCLQWQNAPAGEKIRLQINGQAKLIAFNVSSGSVCVDFTIAANGVKNQGIWAKFEYTTSCNDDAYYDAPYSCEYGGLIRNNNNSTTNQPATGESQSLETKTAVTTPTQVTTTDGVTIETIPVTGGKIDLTDVPVELRVFPNPTHDKLNVVMQPFAGKAVTIQVVNTMGKVVYEKYLEEVNTDQLQLDMSQFASEMYLIKVNVGDEGSYTQKFVVSK